MSDCIRAWDSLSTYTRPDQPDHCPPEAAALAVNISERAVELAALLAVADLPDAMQSHAALELREVRQQLNEVAEVIAEAGPPRPTAQKT